MDEVSETHEVSETQGSEAHEETIEEKLSILKAVLSDLVKSHNENSQMLGNLMNALGLALVKDGERFLLQLMVPKDGQPCGYLSRIVKDIIDLKKDSRIVVPKLTLK